MSSSINERKSSSDTSFSSNDETSNLREMAKIWRASEEIKADERLLSRLTDSSHGRRLISKFDARLRIKREKTGESPVPKFSSYRVYLFSDLVIVGVDLLEKDRERKLNGSDPLQGLIAFDEHLDFDASGSDSDSSSSEEERRRQRYHKRFKLKMWIELYNLNFSHLERKKMEGLSFKYAYKVRGKKAGEHVWITKIKSQNLWFESRKQCFELFDAMRNAKLQLVYHVSKLDERNRELQKAPPGAALRQKKSKRPKDVKGVEEERKQNASKMSKKAKEYALTTSLSAEFTVEFGEGLMGFALSSEPRIGVFVGKIQDNGMADTARVTPGDLVVAVNGREIPKETEWREVVLALKERPVRITFSRCIEAEEEVQHFEEEEESNIRRVVDEGKVGDDAKTAVTTSSKTLSSVEETEGEREKDEKGDDFVTFIKKEPPKKVRLHKERRNRQKNIGTRVADMKTLKQKYLNPHKIGETQRRIDEWFAMLIKRTKDKDENRLLRLLKEIYDTEKKYVNNLLLFDDFKRRMQHHQVHVLCKDTSNSVLFCKHGNVALRCKKACPQMKPLLSRKDIQIIFMNAGEIFEFNKVLLQKLQTGLLRLIEDESRWSVADIVIEYTPAFNDVVPYFKVYSIYASKYQTSLAHIDELCRTSPEFKKLLKAKQSAEETKLKDLLIEPVQRLPRYHLLFENLQKLMDKYVSQLGSKKDNEGLMYAGVDEKMMDKLNEMIVDTVKTFKVIDQVAEEVDRKLGDIQKIEKMIEILGELGGKSEAAELVTPSRKFVDAFDCYYSFTPKGKLQPTKCFLFNDLVLLATEKKHLKEEFFEKLRSSSRLSSLNLPRGKSLRESLSKKLRSASLSSMGSLGSRASGARQATPRDFSKKIKQSAKAKYKTRYHMNIKKTYRFYAMPEKFQGRYGLEFKEKRKNVIEVVDEQSKEVKKVNDVYVFTHRLFFDEEEARNLVMEAIKGAQENYVKDLELTEAAKAKQHSYGTKKRDFKKGVKPHEKKDLYTKKSGTETRELYQKKSKFNGPKGQNAVKRPKKRRSTVHGPEGVGLQKRI